MAGSGLGALVVLLAAALLSLYLQSSDFEALLAGNLTDSLQQLMDKPVSINSLRLDLLGGRVMITGLRVGAGSIDLPDPVAIDLILLQRLLIPLQIFKSLIIKWSMRWHRHHNPRRIIRINK